ncbi:ComE operon protein 1 [Staphylococcus gallinarum]|uniref:ComE operon protein 1 n=1 Tax=Staphylococcus gallinarum TaxID=1293 RepID=A0A380FGH4_STAGA|nr:ComE operon protein 1 [Staphylococcus gallinarum]
MLNKLRLFFVDLKGAVKRPDLYEMKSTDRVKQLLEKAGVQRDADLSQINLSEKLVDQKLIYIPKKGEVSQPNLSKSQNENKVNKSTKTDNTKINLNLATESELQNVPGIGSSKAKAIIEYRNENGAFTTVEDLKKVNGIGVKTFEKLREYFIV